MTRLAVLYHRPLTGLMSGAQRMIIDTYEYLARKGHDVLFISVIPPHLMRYAESKRVSVGFKYVIVKEPAVASIATYPLRLLTLLTREQALVLQVLAAMEVCGVAGKLRVGLNDIIGDIDQRVVVAEQPYVIPMVRHGIRVVRVHNIEYEYLSYLGRNKALRYVSTRLFSSKELGVLSKAKYVITVSYRDFLLLSRMFEHVGKMGLDPLGGGRLVYLEPLILKRGRNLGVGYVHELGLEERRYVLFVGSSHKPNVHAVINLLKVSPELRSYGVKVVIAGSVCKSLRRKYLLRGSDSVRLLGIVDDDALRTLYEYSLAAFTPHIHRSGVPIKLLEAIIHETIPISTPNVVMPPLIRGLKPDVNVLVVGMDRLLYDLPSVIGGLAKDEALYSEVLNNVKRLAESLSPDTLASKYMSLLNRAQQSP